MRLILQDGLLSLFTHESLPHQRLLISFYWSLNDSKSPQVSSTLLIFLSVLNIVVVWMVSTRLPTSKSSSPLSNPFVTVPKEPMTIGIIVICMFHSFWFFFQFPSKVEVLILLLTFFQFYSVVIRDSKGDKFANFLFFCWLLLNLVFWQRLGDPSVCHSPIGVNVCYFLG